MLDNNQIMFGDGQQLWWSAVIATFALIYIMERKYDCKFCDRSFITNSNLLRHERNVHGVESQLTKQDFNCEECDKQFTSVTNRDKHVRTFHDETHTGEITLDSVEPSGVKWRKLSAEGLDLDYAILLPRPLAEKVLKQLEADLQYFSGDLAQVHVYGKWHNIPRQQVAYGDEGLSYKFSGTTVPALPWPPVVQQLRDMVSRITGIDFNFVLVNRYRDGNDHIGEHRDDEKDLDHLAPIASLSLGQRREFVLRHRDARKRGEAKRNIAPVKLMLEHGSLLLMNAPTNRLWYHSLPPRKSCPGVRVNLTFRKVLHKPKGRNK